MIHVIGPIESEMHKKYPATDYIWEPRIHYVAGPQKQVEAEVPAVEALRRKTAEFIKSEHAARLTTIVLEHKRRYEAAQEVLKQACAEHVAAEKAALDKVRAEQREAWRREEDPGPQVEVPRQHTRFHDRNWVDEVFGGEEEWPE